MSVSKKTFGVLGDGAEVSLYTISNGKMTVNVTDYGCTVTSILLPNKNGTCDDVLLGYSTLDGYITSPGYSFGSIVGRFANRIGNAEVTVDGKKYKLDPNDNEINTLHGGFFRLDHVVWASESFENGDVCGVKLTRRSPDGEQGFPGNLDVTVIYSLNSKNELRMEYTAVTDKTTPVNFTNHAYFNLAGNGTILNHELQMDCTGILDIDKNLIPTGKILEVKGTEYDFTQKKTIGKDIAKTGVGYDHCYVTPFYNDKDSGLPLSDEKLVRAAVLSEPQKGRTMTVDTNQEGIQVYTANWIKGIIGKSGRVYDRHEAICLETQCFPDTPNKSQFPSCLLNPDQTYKAVTVYGFQF